MDQIVNKVQQSGIVSINLEDFKPKSQLVGIDIAHQLHEGFLIREKSFRNWIQQEDWSSYLGKFVYIFCSTDAIVPSWTYLLIASKLREHGVESMQGTHDFVLTQLVFENIQGLELEIYENAKVMVKGCADIPNSTFLLVALVNKIQNTVSSIMYGEPCSAVPVYKKAKLKV